MPQALYTTNNTVLPMTPPKDEGKKREATSIKIDPQLWKEAKIEAIRREVDLSDLVEAALKKELKKEKVKE